MICFNSCSLVPDYRQLNVDWIGLRENLQDTIDFPETNMGLSGEDFPLNQSIEMFLMV